MMFFLSEEILSLKEFKKFKESDKLIKSKGLTLLHEIFEIILLIS